MLSMKKRILAVLAVVLLSALAVPVNAAGKKKADKELNEVVKMMTSYTTALKLGERMTRGRVKMPLDDVRMLSMAAFIRYNYKDDAGYTLEELGGETDNLFGKKANLVEGEKEDLFICASDEGMASEPYMYCGGDFGDCIPRYHILKVKKLKNNQYQIKVQNRLAIYGEKGSEKIGTTILKLEKTEQSRYGYIIKKIAFIS